jgi:hypothetical protein
LTAKNLLAQGGVGTFDVVNRRDDYLGAKYKSPQPCYHGLNTLSTKDESGLRVTIEDGNVRQNLTGRGEHQRPRSVTGEVIGKLAL